MAHTPNQAAAITYDKPLIIFAGPGAGKTFTAVAKGARILADPASVLCMVSFTVAAATEMRLRMYAHLKAQSLPDPGSRLICGTFDAIALRHYTNHLGKQHVRMIGKGQRIAMINAMLREYPPTERRAFEESLERYQGALDQSRVQFDDPKHDAFVTAYHTRLAHSQSVDLSIVKRLCALGMLSGEIPLLPVTHMLGDEMQDADEIQLLFMLAHAHRGVTCSLIADDDQSIYDWRSALGFAGLQKFAQETGAKTIALPENFRSRDEIVAAATRLIAYNNPNRVDKQQRAVRGAGGRLGRAQFADVNSQAAFVARYILAHHKPGETVAVLARQNHSLRPIGTALHANAIPYTSPTGKFWDKPPVAAYVATLQGILSAKTGALHPVLSMLPLDGPLLIELERALGADASSLLDGEAPELPSATRTDMNTLTKAAQIFSLWRKMLRDGRVSILVHDVAVNVADWYIQSLAIGSDNSAVVKEVSAVIPAAKDVLLGLKGTLSQRLSTVSRLNESADSEDAVRLMTMHGSKGLEFDTVFLVDADDPENRPVSLHLEAERRLFYVALTRAEERFFVLHGPRPLPFIAEAGLQYLPAEPAPVASEDA